jgi:hypothetical protein
VLPGDEFCARVKGAAAMAQRKTTATYFTLSLTAFSGFLFGRF